MIRSGDIIKELGYKTYCGSDDIILDGVQSLDGNETNKVLFVKKFDEKLIDTINNFINCMILLPKEYSDNIKNDTSCYIFVDSPRLAYAKASNLIISDRTKNLKLINMGDYVIGETSNIGEGSVIEPYAYIGHNVTIGSNCIIMTGAKIRDNVTIGDNCIIRECCVIGGYGFGIEKDENGNNLRLPHVGGVIIGKNVEVGALTTVCSGTIKPTIIENYVKIDDHVHVAHNCIIGENSIITACAEISGSVNVGANAWFAPNTSVKNGITIGKNTTLGMGAVVSKNVLDNDVVVGAMAENFEDAKKFNKIKKQLIKDAKSSNN
jgi:UDP-3-O-[3-hydroxymyristoyl] glucosamine N-acyltransferase